MSTIFISYRRDDSAPYAGRLYDRLSAHFGAGEVFMDIDHIEPGEDFVEVIERKVGACETAVVLIGKRWLAAADASGARRLDDPADFVRLEVAAALQRGARVVPVLVGGASMPGPADLPEPLAALARRNAVELSDSRFHRDVDRLIAALARPATRAEGGAAAPSGERTTAIVTPLQAMAGAAVLAGAGVAAWLFMSPSTPAPEPVVAQAAVESAPVAAIAPAPAPPSRLGNVLGAIAGADQPAAWRGAARERLLRAAQAGGAEAQFNFAVENECVEPRDLQEARRWYRLAAAQGHGPAAAALAALEAPAPADARGREAQALRREVACLSEMQKASSETLDRMNEQARDAIRQIKPAQ